MYSFFVEPNQIGEQQISILGGDVNHIKNVLRMKEGDSLLIGDGVDPVEYECEIAEISESEIRCHILQKKSSDVELTSNIILFQGLPKADKMELIIQKCVELGVHTIVPVAMSRSIVKLDEKKAESKIRRWQTISEAAAKQSKRKHIPEIMMPIRFREAVEMCKEYDLVLVPYEMKKGMKETRDTMDSVKSGQAIAVFIGPEGGFSEEEINQAIAIGAVPISLGKRILRTETAGFTTLAWLMYQLETMDL